MKKVLLLAGLAGMVAANAEAIDAVSYTHLDVYKRQDIICYSTPRRICGRTAAPPFLLCAVCLRRHQKAS